MKMSSRIYRISTIMLFALPLVSQSGDQPPQAPDNNYRHYLMDGTVLVYDAANRFYVLEGMPDHYFHAGQYYRFRAGTWEAASELQGPWMAADTLTLPPALKEGPRKKKKRKPGRGY